MNALSLTLASLLALTGLQIRALAADPAAHPSTEAADRQFLAALENGDPAPAPVAAGAPDTPAQPEPAVKKQVAPKASAAPIMKKEAASPRVASAVPKKPAPTVAKRETRRAPEEIEVRRAIPVTVTTTTTTYGTRVDHDDDNDRDHDHDEDDDHDHDHDRHDGFFDRLFRGEKIFR